MKRFMLTAALAAMAAGPALAQYTVMAPASPGGGWDQTARTIQQVMQETGVAEDVQVVNVPGAGGTIGLAQFASQNEGDPNNLIVGGYVMVGAILNNKSPVTLDDVTPIARLTGEYEGIVVPASSDIETIDQLIERLREDPGSVSWAGGSAGGVDHIAVGLIAEAAGVDPKAINYIAYSGGGEALASILGGQVTAGVSGISEFQQQVEAGNLRWLAVTSPERIEGIDAPTLQEAGLDVTVENWRMVAAPPGLSEEEVAKIEADVEAMATSEAWAEQLAQKGWQDSFLAGDAFDEQLAKEIAATEKVLRNIGLVE